MILFAYRTVWITESDEHENIGIQFRKGNERDGDGERSSIEQLNWNEIFQMKWTLVNNDDNNGISEWKY